MFTRRVVFALTLVLLVAGCSFKSDAQQAADFLAAGLQAHLAGNIDEAARNYQSCLTHEPTNKYCLYNLGVIAQAQGNTVDAEDYYSLAIEQDPQFTSPLFNLAIMRATDGATDEAIDLYRRVISADPNSAAAHYNLGLLLISKGDVAGGRAELEQANQIDPAYGVPSLPPATQSPSVVPSPTATAGPS